MSACAWRRQKNRWEPIPDDLVIDDLVIPEGNPNVTEASYAGTVGGAVFCASGHRRFTGHTMDGFFWAGVTFAIAGLLAVIIGCFWRRNANPDDFGAVVIGLIFLVVCEAIAIVLAVIGFIVKAI